MGSHYLHLDPVTAYALCQYYYTMKNNEEFLLACAHSGIREISKMISEGVDINGVNNRYGYSGLMLAMGEGNTEAAGLLLGCPNIKIDIQDIHGYTALHHACGYKQVESVKLFLKHPACNKDIVKMRTNRGITAENIASRRTEIIAGVKGNQDCARLVREYLAVVEEDNRNVDDLVEYITREGETERKKKTKKRKSRVQSSLQSKNTGCITENIDVKSIKDDLKTETNMIAKVDSVKDPEINIYKESPEKVHSITNTKRTHMENVKLEIEKKIAEKHVQFGAEEQNLKHIIEANSAELKILVFNIEKSEDEKKIKLNEVNKLDEELSNLERKMAEIRLRKLELVQETQIAEERNTKLRSKVISLGLFLGLSFCLVKCVQTII